MPAHEDALLMAAGTLKADEYYDFNLERVCVLPPESVRRAQGICDAKAQKPKLSSDASYVYGYELQKRLRSTQ
jgi:hypothetical protein